MTAIHNDHRKANQPMKPATIPLYTCIVIIVALAVLASPCAIRADVVTDWNQITLATQASVPGGIRTPPAARALAMVHLAIFDSVNAIDRRFTPYLVEPLADPSASPEAAAVAAAHTVLAALYPSRQADLDLAYNGSLTAIPDGQAKDDGIDVGESVAAALLALRSADGSAVQGNCASSGGKPEELGQVGQMPASAFPFDFQGTLPGIAP